MTASVPRATLRIVLPYTLLAGIWIFLSDRALEALIGDPRRLSAIQSVKGWAFVALTSLLLFWALRRELRAREDATGALQHTETLLQGVLDNTTAFVYLKDVEGRFLTVNRRFEELFGIAHAQAIGKTEYDLLPRNLADRLRIDDKKALAAGKPTEIEEEIAQGNGTHTYLSLKFPIYSVDGSPYAVCNISSDISDRKQMEQILGRAIAAEQAARREAENARMQAESILARIDDGFVAIDRNGRFTYVNRRAGELARRDPRHLIGKSVWDAFPENVNGPFHGAYQRALAARQPTEAEEYIPQHDRWYTGRVYPSDAGVVVFFHDITDRKRTEIALRASEARFRGVLESGMFGILFWNAAGTVYDANDYLLNLIGYTRVDLESGNILLHDLTPPEFEHADRRAWQEIATRGVCTPFEKEYRRKDGRRVPILIGGAAIDREHRDCGVCFVVNIGAQKHAEQALRESSSRLQRLSQRLLTIQEHERRRLARELHDEIGQALTAVSINLQSLEKPAAGGRPLDESIDIVDKAIQQVRALSLNLRPSMLDDLGLEAALRWYVDRTAARSGIDILLHSEIGDMRFAPTIETSCFRVVQEALTNVLRHAHATRVDVGVHHENDRLRIAVDDNGVGFDDAAARVRMRAGESFGLAGMEERTHLSGGDLCIETAPGQGTRLTMTVPLKADRDAQWAAQ